MVRRTEEAEISGIVRILSEKRWGRPSVEESFCDVVYRGGDEEVQ